MQSWADLRGSKFFQFHGVFGENWLNHSFLGGLSLHLIHLIA